MSLEVEAKLRVESHDEVRRRLVAAGARQVSRVIETNVILEHPELLLRQSGCGLRVRRSVSADPSALSKVKVTFKGAPQPGIFKTREETELAVDDFEAAIGLFGHLGFAKLLWYEKRRESWKLQSCDVELDEPARLGLFVEVEGPDEAAIQSVLQALALEDLPHIRWSYVAMLIQYCDERQISPRVLRFETHD